jgi:hypothetical protein
VAEQNWHRIDKAPRGIGPLLLRAGAGSTDPAYVGYQDPDSGRWLDGENRDVHPTHFALVARFDQFART